ncbi:hypothetical protein SteCoe_11851 [Stentor coeruleus]|uniref:Uncharacterized protein n=1 Tax=Stentor coeruleus TaxID=5963 RepID=A0A1R2CC30_9CILI|nr:hypothetical protein SteCoe_11851 [Stentor coeruleus]
MKALEVEMRFLEDFTDQLDTIEEESQESTPQLEHSRQQVMDFSRRLNESFNSKSDELSNIFVMDDLSDQINDIKGSFHEINEELSVVKLNPKSIVEKVFNLKSQMHNLQTKLENCTAKISETENENHELMSKLKQLEEFEDKSQNPKCLII